jgi:hypothetical protein
VSGGQADTAPVTVVSGLPRSGTSMMMRMLEAGGLPVLVAGLRTADEDNPRGYYEFERVKQLADDTGWLPEARGKGGKIISALLLHLPPCEHYRIVFMRRDLGEVLASQREMLRRRGEPTDATADEEMARFFTSHLRRVEGWLAAQPHCAVRYVSYNDLLREPGPLVEEVAAFLGDGLDPERMREVVSQRLYRQRS